MADLLNPRDPRDYLAGTFGENHDRQAHFEKIHAISVIPKIRVSNMSFQSRYKTKVLPHSNMPIQLRVLIVNKYPLCLFDGEGG